MSGRPNPFEGLEELFDRMSRQWENAARMWDVDGGVSFATGTDETTHGLDLADHGDEFVVTVDVPGFERDDVSVRLSGETLHVRGEREREVDESAETYIRRERRSRSFDRRVRLPEPTDRDGVNATLNNGVLTITLPKQEPAEEGTSIEIE